MKQKTKFKKTEIGMIPENWEVKELGDLLGHKKGFAFKSSWYKTEGKRIIKVSDLTKNSINFSNCVYLGEKQARDFSDWEVKKDDIIITTVGSWPNNPASIVGKVVKVPEINEPCLLNQNAVRIRGKKDINQIFLYYLMKSKKFSDYLIGNAQGSANQASITLNDIFSFEFLLPPLPEQKSIANILSTLDSKIELLQKQNKTLEEIGQAIFKKWFVDNPEKRDWEVSTIGKELKTILGGTPSRVKPEYWKGNINWINSGKVNEFRIIKPSETITEEGLNKSATSLLPAGSVVLAITGATLGQVSRLEIDSCANQSVVGILENEKFSSPYIYYWIKNRINDIIGHQTGGAQQHINKGNIDNYQLLIPDEKTLKNFNKIAELIFKRISNNCFNIQTLAQIRDLLLPKLISGKMRVPVEVGGK